MSDTVVTAKFVADTTSLQAGAQRVTTSLRGVDDGVRKTAMSMNALKGGFIAAGAAVGMLALKMGVDAVKAAAEEEKAVVKLGTALKNVGQEFRLGEVEKFVDDLQRASGVADDELRPALQTLITATGNATQAQDLLGSALDISAATGRDLTSVSIALAKASNGQFMQINRLTNGAINPAILSTKDLGLVTAELERLYGGQAQANAETFAGKIDRLTIAYEELLEAFGTGFIEGITSASDATEDMGNAFRAAEPGMREFGKTLGELGLIISYVSPFFDDVVNMFKFAVPTALATAAAAFPPLIPLVSYIGTTFLGSKASVDAFANSVDIIGVKFTGPMSAAAQAASTGIRGVGDAAEEATEELAAMKAEMDLFVASTNAISAVDAAAEKIDNLGAASVEFGTNLMGQTPKARDFRAEVVSAFEASAKAAQSLSDDLPTQRAIFTGELIKIVASLRESGVKDKDIEAFLGAMDGLPASVADIMRSAAKAVGDTDFKTEVEKAFRESVKAGTPMTADAMERLAEGASKAAKSKLGLTLEPELASVIKSGTTALRPTAFLNGQLTGKSIGSGMANGIQASSPIVQAAVARVVAQAKAAADAAAKVGSPSRLFAETGDDITAGIGMGIIRSTRKATGAIVNVVAAISKQMNKLLTGITKMIDREMKAASDAGKEQLQKFLDAVTKSFDAFKARMQTLRDISKEWMDFTKGVRETTPTLESSLARVDNLYRRIEQSVNAKGKVTDKTIESVRRMSEALRNELATALDIAQSDLDEVQGKFNDLKDTVAGAIRGILSFSDARAIGEEIGGGFLEGLRIQAEKAAAFAAIIDQLRRQGLSEEALRLVIQAGAEAGTAIGSELIAGGTEAIQEANDLVAAVGTIADQIGLDTAGQFYGAGVAAAQAQVDGILDQIDKMTPQIMRWMDKLAKKMKRQTIIEVKLSQDKFKVTIDVDKVVREIIAGEGTTVRATAMAAGGIVTRPTFAMVGEAGPEAVIPLSQASRYGIGPDESNKYFTIENLNVYSAPGERSEDTVPRALRRMAFAMGYDD